MDGNGRSSYFDDSEYRSDKQDRCSFGESRFSKSDQKMRFLLISSLGKKAVKRKDFSLRGSMKPKKPKQEIAALADFDNS